MSTPIAIVAGVGPGTGAEVARRFSGSYPVVLLARDSQNLEGIAEEINKGGGRAVGIIANVSNPESMKNAFRKIEQEFKGAPIAAAVFNASSRPLRAPIVEVKLEDLKKLIVSYEREPFCSPRMSFQVFSNTPRMSPPDTHRLWFSQELRRLSRPMLK
ncbi:hypothetical protein BST61_g9166 [Cercospora zeina]